MKQPDRHSNYSRGRVVVVEGVAQEAVCRRCKGTGEDPHHPSADCTTCWGDGTLPLQDKATDP